MLKSVRAPRVFSTRFNLAFCVVTLLVLISLFLPGCSPQSIVVASATEGQAPFTVTFTNTSKNADEYRWDFGDGSSLTTATTEEPVSHEYTIAGTHTVTLTVYKAKSPDKASTSMVTINVKPGVLSQINVTPATAELAIGGSNTFIAKAADIYDNPIPEATFSWEAAAVVGIMTADGALHCRH